MFFKCIVRELVVRHHYTVMSQSTVAPCWNYWCKICLVPVMPPAFIRHVCSEGDDKPKRGRPSNIVRAAAAAAASAAIEAHGYSRGGEASPSRGPQAPPLAPEHRPYHQARSTGYASSAPPAPPLSPERLSQVGSHFRWVQSQCSF